MPGAEKGEDGHHEGDTPSRAIPDPRTPSRRKSKKAADTERRERHRQAEERLAAERAQRREDNRIAREREAAERAERQRSADAERERERVREEERTRQAAARQGRRRASADADDTEAQAAARERKRKAAEERRAARAERDRRRDEQKAEQRRAREDERRAEREAVQARTRRDDPYVVLGVAPDTTAEEVDRAYRRLARANHPDLHRDATPQDRAAREAQMKRVNVAYGILGDAQRRRAYDRLRRKA